MFHHADVEVPVFDRPGEVPLLEGSAHPFTLALGHVTAKDGDFGPSADARVEGPHEHVSVASMRERFVAENADARFFDPESSDLKHIPSVLERLRRR
jgi:hypothetical protein